MKKILISVSIIAGVAAIVVGATTAFFSDTETSAGNVFTAGAIDLTVDSTCHYWQNNGGGYVDVGCPQTSTWMANNWGAANKFCESADIKPGDKGENTISLHVNNNDAWVRLVISAVTNNDNGLTEPEGIVDTTDGVGNGELRQNLKFSMWLDWGAVAGFQNDGDPTEGDNIQQSGEPTLISEGTIDPDGTVSPGISEIWNLKDFNNSYLPGGKTAYFGVKWNLPSTVGNEVQTDSMSATMEFQVQQVRNNPNPVW